MTTCCDDIMCTRTLSTTISFRSLRSPFRPPPPDMAEILTAAPSRPDQPPERGVRRGRSVGCSLGTPGLALPGGWLAGGVEEGLPLPTGDGEGLGRTDGWIDAPGEAAGPTVARSTLT